MGGHLVLPHPGQGQLPLPGDEGDHVGLHPEAGAGVFQVVGHDHVQVLALQLGPGVGHHVPGLHGEPADEEAGVAVLGHPAQDVVGAGQGNGKGIVGLLHLVLGHGGRAVVRHGGGLDEDVRLGQQILHRPEHVRRRGHRPGVHEGDQGQAGGASDQGDLGPPEHGLPGDGIPHPAGAVVGEEAHRVQGLLGGAGGHRHPHPLEGLGPGQLPGDVIQEDLRLGHLSAAHRLAGQQAAVRRDDLKAVALQGL